MGSKQQKIVENRVGSKTYTVCVSHGVVSESLCTIERQAIVTLPQLYAVRSKRSPSDLTAEAGLRGIRPVGPIVSRSIERGGHGQGFTDSRNRVAPPATARYPVSSYSS